MIALIFMSDIKVSACITLWSFEIVQICLFLFSFKKSSNLVKISQHYFSFLSDIPETKLYNFLILVLAAFVNVPG